MQQADLQILNTLANVLPIDYQRKLKKMNSIIQKIKAKNFKLELVLAFFALSVLAACTKENLKSNNGSSGLFSTDSLIAPVNFPFNTTRSVSININLATNNNKPITGVPVNIYSGDPATSSPILTAVSDNNGLLQAQLEIPSYIDTLVVDPSYIGLMRNAQAVIIDNSVTGTIGGPNGFSGNIREENKLSVNAQQSRLRARTLGLTTASTASTTYQYMAPYDSLGVPGNLVSPSDVISAKLLSYLNASLPEAVNVQTLHPEYLTSTATADINIVQTADVWITFLSEGAGYLNAVGFYTYTTGNPPQSAADITQITYLFPNASLPGSGGNLKSGSKVKLGTFNAGTSIGYVLFSNGWNGTAVNPGAQKFYSTTACNPETDPNLKRHTVLLYSSDENLYLIGFEDMFRQNPACDNDFNDVVFYATSDPVTAISSQNVQPLDEPKDSDGDGVPDNLDAFPNDPTRAHVNYYPSAKTFGTLAFEDLWPATGDYDLNDLVVGYRYKTVTNAQNLAVEIYADYVVQASGASYVSGFGVQFPFSPGQVKTVTGQKLIGNYIKQNSNATEALQSKTVVIPFDNYQAVIKRPGGYYINSQLGAPYVKSDTVHLYMSFTSPLSSSTLGSAPFNPFLISNQRRGYEVHLPNHAPTDLADMTLFGTLQDNSNPGLGRYYVSKKSWPWALNFSGPFAYPTEGTNISKAYNYFLPWAQSGGTQYQNWYLSAPGNINQSLIYTH